MIRPATWYSDDEIRKTYERVPDLLATKYIIRSYSTNRADIRQVALDRCDLSDVLRLIDLGCGYGFFIEALKGRLHEGAEITGMDLVESNEVVFLETAAATGYAARFINASTDRISSIEDGAFDCAISSYSLYFFPHLIREISRILKKGGLFIVLTHSERSLEEVLQYITECVDRQYGSTGKFSSLRCLFSAFSLENGRKLLEPYFNSVQTIVYPNVMIFGRDQVDDCIYYLEKKRTLIYRELIDAVPERVVELERCVGTHIADHVREHGAITLNKDDGIFICTK